MHLRGKGLKPLVLREDVGWGVRGKTQRYPYRCWVSYLNPTYEYYEYSMLQTRQGLSRTGFGIFTAQTQHKLSVVIDLYGDGVVPIGCGGIDQPHQCSQGCTYGHASH